MPIIVTIFSLVIPLLMQVITKIDEKYNSSVIVAIFKRETLYVSISILAIVTVVYICFASLVWLEVFNSGICKCVSEKIGILLCCSDFCVVILLCRLILTYYDANKLYDRIKDGEKDVNAVSDLAKYALRTSNIELSRKTSQYFSDLLCNESKLQDYGYWIDEINHLMCKENLCDKPYWGNAMTLNYYLEAFKNNSNRIFAQNHIIWNLNNAIEYNQDNFIKQYWKKAKEEFSQILCQNDMTDKEEKLKRNTLIFDYEQLHVVLGAALLSHGKNQLLEEIFISTTARGDSCNLFPKECSCLAEEFNSIQKRFCIEKYYSSQISIIWIKRFYIALFFHLYSRVVEGDIPQIGNEEMLEYIKEIYESKYRDLYYPFFRNPDKIDEIVADICK